MHKINRLTMYATFALLGLLKCSYVHQEMRLPFTKAYIGVAINAHYSPALLLADTVYFQLRHPLTGESLELAHHWGL